MARSRQTHDISDTEVKTEERAANVAPLPKWKGILGMPASMFLTLTALVLVTASFTPADTGMTVALAIVMMQVGTLMWIGERIPVFNFIGGGVILCILAPAIAQYLGIFPENLEESIVSFYDVSGFGVFVVAALITGSILGMPKQMLIKAGSRMLVPMLVVISVVFLVLGLIVWITELGAGYAIFYIAGQVLGGGVAAGSISLSEIVSRQ